jgi:general secretion pathway protein F
MFVRTALLYEEETSRWIDRFTKVFEPVLMAAIGLVIGVIVVLLYLPIFELAGSFR